MLAAGLPSAPLGKCQAGISGECIVMRSIRQRWTCICCAKGIWLAAAGAQTEVSAPPVFVGCLACSSRADRVLTANLAHK